MKYTHDRVVVAQSPDSGQVRSLSSCVRHGGMTPSSEPSGVSGLSYDGVRKILRSGEKKGNSDYVRVPSIVSVDRHLSEQPFINGVLRRVDESRVLAALHDELDGEGKEVTGIIDIEIGLAPGAVRGGGLLVLHLGEVLREQTSLGMKLLERMSGDGLGEFLFDGEEQRSVDLYTIKSVRDR